MTRYTVTVTIENVEAESEADAVEIAAEELAGDTGRIVLFAEARETGGEESDRLCALCGDAVHTLSTRDLCDGCEAESEALTYYVTRRGSTVEIAADSSEHALRRVLGEDATRFAISAYGDFAEARLDGEIVYVAIRARDQVSA